MHFRRNLGKFLIYEFFDFEDIDLGSPNLHAIEIYSHNTSHKNLVILAFIGTELAGEKPADCPRRILGIGGAIFGPRSIFDPVLGGQRSSFREIGNFSNLL